MKKLTLLITLTVSMMFSPVCWGEWVKVSKNLDGSTHSVEFDRIRQHEGYVYFWEMIDYLTPQIDGFMSGEIYKQGDCEMFRFKSLSFTVYKEPMGGGTGDSYSPENPEWKYPPLIPDSSFTVLKSVCSR